MFRFILLAGGACALATVPALAPLLVSPAQAQTASTELPPVAVTARPDGSLTVPSVAEQRRQVLQTPGSVGWIDAETLKGTYTNNLRDVLKDVPGVWVQPRYGQELRLSVRGAGIARAFHGRGIEILQDGIPFNMADGSFDLYQIDPLALRSAEVYKGGNALAFGSSTLGGAMNFITPTAQTAVAPNILRFEAGSFGTWRANAQVSRVLGDVDFMVNATVSHGDGFRKHARQQYEQFNANIGYRITPNIETRFYAGVYFTDQKLPGTLGLRQALTNPTQASAAALAGDQARNVRTQRLANRTTIRLEDGQIDLDTWFMHKNLYHPIFQVIDQDGYTYGFAPRYTATGQIGGLRNELVLGGRLFGGNNRALQFVNIGGSRGRQTLNARQNAWSIEGYVEDRLYVMPDLAAVAGVKMFHAERQYTNFGNLPPFSTVYQNNSATYDGVNPKLGLLWEPRKDIQGFINITRSQDVPDFSDLTQTQFGGSTKFVPLQAQKAWTLELGTRGRHDRFAWDVTLYLTTPLIFKLSQKYRRRPLVLRAFQQSVRSMG
jgi:iron complex outermembrane receptor protein